MNKSLEALLRGYIWFEVNVEGFLTYNAALAKQEATKGDVEFRGLHIWKGWRSFYTRFTAKEPVPVITMNGNWVTVQEEGGQRSSRWAADARE